LIRMRFGIKCVPGVVGIDDPTLPARDEVANRSDVDGVREILPEGELVGEVGHLFYEIILGLYQPPGGRGTLATDYVARDGIRSQGAEIDGDRVGVRVHLSDAESGGDSRRGETGSNQDVASGKLLVGDLNACRPQHACIGSADFPARVGEFDWLIGMGDTKPFGLSKSGERLRLNQSGEGKTGDCWDESHHNSILSPESAIK
jgi:hypothetical protein